MNVLVIGNGFDIAHGLKTRYIDFLDFLKALNDCRKDHSCCDNSDVLNYRLENPNYSEEMLKLYENNCWFQWISSRYKSAGERWVDFELRFRM